MIADLLLILAVGSFIAASFMVSIPLGLAVFGLSCLVLSLASVGGKR